MKLFFRHLFRSVKKRPLQPIILIVTIMLAVIVSCSAFLLADYVNEENRIIQSVKYGNSDITITLSSTSKSRFMFAERAEEIIGDKGVVAGAYELPMFKGEKQTTVFGVATEIDKIGNVFDLEFSEYGKITSNTKDEVAFITREFAEKENLSVGKEFTLNVLGKDTTYTVCAISETPYFASYDVLVNITGVMRVLASDSLFVSALGEKFKPCSTLYVDIAEGVEVKEVVDLLKSDVDFEDKTFNNVAGLIEGGSSADALEIVIDIIIALTIALCVAVIFCCFYIIASQRTDENYSFNIVGAKAWMLNVIQYVEILLYWGVGAGLGMAVVKPIVSVIVKFVGYVYVRPHIIPSAVLNSLGITLFACLITITAFVLIGKKFVKKKRKLRLWFWALLAFVVFGIALFLVPIKVKALFSMLTLIAFIAFLFVFVPPLFKKAMEKLNAIIENKGKVKAKRSVGFRYAVKNVKNVNVLLNTCRLTVLLFAIITCVFLTVVSSNKVLYANKSYIKGDLAVVNATETCVENLSEVQSAEGVYSIFYDVCSANGYVYIPIVSTSNIKALSGDLGLDHLPKGNNAVLAKGYADRLGVKAGDELEIALGEKKIIINVEKVSDSMVNLIVFDAFHFGIGYNMLSVDGKDGVSIDQLRKDVSKATALDLVTIMPIEDVFEHRTKSAEIYINFGHFLSPMVFLFAIIGLIDNLVESYRARRNEFELYNLAGMTKREIRKMKFFELVLVFSFAIVVSLIASTIITVVINEGLRTIGYRYIFSIFW